jgi:hypothetical protein
VPFGSWSISQVTKWPSFRRLVRPTVVGLASILVGFAIGATAQTIEGRQWQGATAVTRQPEQVVAMTLAEWRSLWTRVGIHAPDLFEPGRMSAIGIFLGARPGTGYAVNVLSTSRRRDRIMVVFEERAPADIMLAQRAAPAAPRPISGGGPSFGPPGGAAGFAPPGTMANIPTTAPTRPSGPVTSPWAIVLIPRADLPVSVEQRWFR